MLYNIAQYINSSENFITAKYNWEIENDGDRIIEQQINGINKIFIYCKNTLLTFRVNRWLTKLC